MFIALTCPKVINNVFKQLLPATAFFGFTVVDRILPQPFETEIACREVRHRRHRRNSGIAHS